MSDMLGKGVASFKAVLRLALPYSILQAWNAYKNKQNVDPDADVKTIFSAIYKSNKWGGQPGDFFSGSGSDAQATIDYVRVVTKFISDHQLKSVVDIGCGDFRVGAQIVKSGLNYIGVDVVPNLIERNNREFARPGLVFIEANAIEDEMPDADLCLIRQVLQHLSNEQIIKILSKCAKYKYVIVAEHHAGQSHFKKENCDKFAGSDVRVFQGSGVYLEKHPFVQENLSVLVRSKPSKWLLSRDEVITTYLIKN